MTQIRHVFRFTRYQPLSWWLLNLFLFFPQTSHVGFQYRSVYSSTFRSTHQMANTCISAVSFVVTFYFTYFVSNCLSQQKTEMFENIFEFIVRTLPFCIFQFNLSSPPALICSPSLVIARRNQNRFGLNPFSINFTNNKIKTIHKLEILM